MENGKLNIYNSQQILQNSQMNVENKKFHCQKSFVSYYSPSSPSIQTPPVHSIICYFSIFLLTLNSRFFSGASKWMKADSIRHLFIIIFITCIVCVSQRCHFTGFFNISAILLFHSNRIVTARFFIGRKKRAYYKPILIICKRLGVSFHSYKWLALVWNMADLLRFGKKPIKWHLQYQLV